MIELVYRLADRARWIARGNSPAAQGRRGEDLAHRHLRRHGCIVTARNYRPPSGGVEVDLVAWDGDALAFVEVKTRATDEFGPPERAVDREKQGFVVRAAHAYVRRAGVEWDRVRFDIVSIVLTEPPKVEWIKDAFR